MILQRNALQDNKVDMSDTSELQHAYEEGFGSASGVRGATSEMGGRIRHPESGDEAMIGSRPVKKERENSGLADN